MNVNEREREAVPEAPKIPDDLVEGYGLPYTRIRQLIERIAKAESLLRKIVSEAQEDLRDPYIAWCRELGLPLSGDTWAAFKAGSVSGKSAISEAKEFLEKR